MNKEFIKALDILEEERNINKAELIEAIESSIASAYQKNYNTEMVTAHLDPETGEITVRETKNIVEEVEDPAKEISLEEARKVDAEYEPGDVFVRDVAPKDFGRIAAQNAKQLIVQRIKDAERDIIYNEYKDRVGELINGTITRTDTRGNVFVNIGTTEALLPPSEQIAKEEYIRNKRMQVYLLSVDRGTKGPSIKVSRTHPMLLKRLFELQVPEIHSGLIEVKDIVREPGARSKISVFSQDKTIDAVGACVGPKGQRVQGVINQLSREKIDIISYNEDIGKFIANALSPATVSRVLADPEQRKAIAIVDDGQLSLAIGKEGINVRLAAKLTGWKIDIKSKTAYAKLLEENPNFEAEFLNINSPLADRYPDVFVDEKIFQPSEEGAGEESIPRNLDDLFSPIDDSESQDEPIFSDDAISDMF